MENIILMSQQLSVNRFEKKRVLRKREKSLLQKLELLVSGCPERQDSWGELSRIRSVASGCRGLGPTNSMFSSDVIGRQLLPLSKTVPVSINFFCQKRIEEFDAGPLPSIVL